MTWLLWLLPVLLAAALVTAGGRWLVRLKQRRALNRLGLEDPDAAVGICASFLYAMRWLRAGGGVPPNRPYSSYGAVIGERCSPELRARFEAVLPLWQEAAYSDHPMSPEERDEMKTFETALQSAVWANMSRRARLRARLVDAL